jgi:hypothetical protein
MWLGKHFSVWNILASIVPGFSVFSHSELIAEVRFIL